MKYILLLKQYNNDFYKVVNTFSIPPKKTLFNKYELKVSVSFPAGVTFLKTTLLQ
jgi:hypothetical protein